MRAMSRSFTFESVAKFPYAKREAVVVIANVERTAQSLRQALHKAELTAVCAPANRGRLELQAHGLAFRTFDVVYDALAVGERGLDFEGVLGGQEFPVEEVIQLSPVDRKQRSTGENPSSSAMLPGWMRATLIIHVSYQTTYWKTMI